MYNIKIESSFSAAHNLRNYKGKCEELHGHNWKVEIRVAKDKLDKAGMVLDFKDLKMKLRKVLEKLDHKYLNRVPYFSAASAVGGSGGKKVNPTSENIAKYIYDCLRARVTGLKSVTVWESDNSCATYYE